MQIYITCPASYNNGTMHGKWIDATSDVDEMQEDVDVLLREVPSAEEFAIHDFDGISNLGNIAVFERLPIMSNS